MALCVVSIAGDHASVDASDSSAAHLLLRMTPLQAAVLQLVAATFLFELGQSLSEQRVRRRSRRHIGSADWRLLSHHVIGLIGIALQLRRSVGGGMMVRLLLDVLTDFAQYGRECLNRRQFGSGEVPFALVFAFLRLVSGTATAAWVEEVRWSHVNESSCYSFFPPPSSVPDALPVARCSFGTRWCCSTRSTPPWLLRRATPPIPSSRCWSRAGCCSAAPITAAGSSPTSGRRCAAVSIADPRLQKLRP